jgi:hypothetical protein
MQSPIFGSNKTEPPCPTPNDSMRKIPIIWEYTQAIIACFIVLCNMIVGIHIGLLQGRSELPVTLDNALFVVIGFYFGRSSLASIHKGK